MKRFLINASIFLLCGALAIPAVSAQTRGRNNNSGVKKTTPAATRPSVNQPATRPGNSGSTPAVRPGNNNNNNNRPGAQPPQGNNRPGNQPPQGNNNRPGNQPPQGNNRPGNNGGFIGGQRPNYKPAPPPPPPHHGSGPSRPNMPPVQPWFRPTPPPAWRPPSAWRSFNTILGVALGTSINLTINSLINSGYNPSVYNSNSVYVNNVPMLNMVWPDAILYYNNRGGLCGSRFVYTTYYQDMTRYNSAYASLVSIYGSPYSMQNTASGIEANWWGTGNQFITLSYSPVYTSGGSVAYYTTLTFGN